MSLESVACVQVPSDVVAETEAALREAGREGYERFVLWSGEIDDTRLVVRTAHHPDQRAYRLPDGLCVTIDGEALHALNVWLLNHQELLAVQIHSHPGEAYHSDTDNTYPVVTALGGLSIVTPDFCSGPLLGRGCAVLRLSRLGWEDVDPSLFTVV